MWANARDELLRPGFKGGGGGSPFVEGAVRTTAATTGGNGASTFFEAAAVGLTLAAFTGACTEALGKGMVTDLGTDFCATFVAGFMAVFAAVFATVFAAVFALTAVLGTGLLMAFGASLAEGLTIDFAGCGLATGDFLMLAVFAAGLTALFVATTAALGLDLALTTLATLTAWTTFATGFAFALGAVLAAAFGCDLDATVGFFADLAAALTAVFDFFVCAFTSGLLWQTARG